ncbi:MAG: septum formation initiator family protein [Verrucomicrobiota bacterium]
MNVDLGIWTKLTRAIICLLLIAAVAGVVVWYLPLIDSNEAFRKSKLKLELQIKQEEEKQRQLKSSIRSLQEDSKTLERIAREKLGYARTNETVIRFDAPAPNAVQARP